MLTGLHGRYVGGGGGGHCYAVQFFSKNYEKNLLVVSLPYLSFCIHFFPIFCYNSKLAISIVNLHLHQQWICLVHGTLEGETQARCR